MLRCLVTCSEHVGHLNPTLPLVKAMVDSGHEVHFMCLELARAKVEELGAVFHSTTDVQTELYTGRGGGDAERPKMAVFSIMEEHGLEMSFLNIMKCLNLSLELELLGTLRFLKRLKPDVVIYDPLITSRAAPLAASVLGIPAVGVLTLAGPGAMKRHGPALLGKMSLEEAGLETECFEPHVAATRRINEMYDLALKPTHLLPDGYLDTCLSNQVLVTTSEDLQDPITEALSQAYARDGARFTFVGPLLLPPAPDDAKPVDSVICRLREARAAGKRVVAVSMGTVVTGGDKVAGWDADFDGKSIAGRELCRAVWSGSFDACSGPDFLVVAALGFQQDPLGSIQVPSHALCVPSFRQVELLRAGVDVFVTHGGQNSFTEALSCGTPVLVCPGFGDQVVNAAKAVSLGVGLKVDRPELAGRAEAAAAAARYREDVRTSLQKVLASPAYRVAAEAQASRLRGAGGVPRALRVIVKAAEGGRMLRSGAAGAVAAEGGA